MRYPIEYHVNSADFQTQPIVNLKDRIDFTMLFILWASLSATPQQVGKVADNPPDRQISVAAVTGFIKTALQAGLRKNAFYINYEPDVKKNIALTSRPNRGYIYCESVSPRHIYRSA
jgi:hypothetical protein